MRANERSDRPSGPLKTRLSVTRTAPILPSLGKTAVVIGRSKNVGLPMAMLMHSDAVFRECPGLDATVTICHRYTPPDILKQMTLQVAVALVTLTSQLTS